MTPDRLLILVVALSAVGRDEAAHAMVATGRWPVRGRVYRDEGPQPEGEPTGDAGALR